MLQEGWQLYTEKGNTSVNKITTVLRSLESEISRYDFQKAVDFFEGDKHLRKFPTRRMFSTLVFGQLTNGFSIREIQHGLEANNHRLYHNGLSPIKRSTFADAMAKRDYRIFILLHEQLAETALVLSGRKTRRFKNPLRLIDSTMIEVNVNRFPWAKYRQTKGGMKLHVSYDPETALIDQLAFTDGKVHDCNRFSSLSHQPGVIYVADRAYCDFKSLYRIEINGGYFVTRVKKNACFHVEEVLSQNQNGPLRRDCRVTLTGPQTKKDYPKSLRIVEYYDESKERVFAFLTNDFTHTAQEIADMYKERWEIELFFKWLKQNLKIKTFWGTSRNAVLTQIWVALIVYLLIWILKMKNMVDYSLQRIRQILKTTLLDKIPLDSLFKPPPVQSPSPPEPYLFEAVS
jgi:hypothetical protein